MGQETKSASCSANQLKKVCVLGCGAMGTVLANLVAKNVVNSTEYEHSVLWHIRDEEHEGVRLSDFLKNNLENRKYAPGIPINNNVIISTDASEVASMADVLIFAFATRHVHEILELIKPHLKADVLFVTFSKGLMVTEPNSYVRTKEIRLVSEEIRRVTGKDAVVVSGAITAKGLAREELAEVTIGAKNREAGMAVKRLLETDVLMLTYTEDATSVEICGALKNILCVAAGLVDGLKLGANTKSAIIRLGLYEMGQYCRFMYAKYDTKTTTLLQSCGVSELFMCMLRQSDLMPQVGDDWDFFNLLIGRMLSDEKYSSMSLEEIEKSLHPEYVASGPDTAKKIYAQLSELHLCERYPLFTAVHLICIRTLPSTMLIPMLRHHPAHA